MSLSKAACESLKITEGLSLNIKSVGPGEFRLGPIIGILTFPHVIVKKRLITYLNYAKRMTRTGLLYIFKPEDINSKTNTIIGYRYNEAANSWQKGVFPYPDAVIDRIYPNNPESHHKLEKVIGQNRIFNKKNLINKMEFYRALTNDSFLKEFIPETRLFRHISDLDYFLNKYPEVFLKPMDGMKGKGIISVIPRNGRLLCQYMDSKIPVSKQVDQTSQLPEIMRRVGGHSRSYIVQAAIQRMEYRRRPFNFRVLVTKNSSGKWAAPAVFAKAAIPGGFLTNRSLGAEYILLKNLFDNIKDHLPYSKDDFYDLVTDLSLKAATALDNEFGPLGKLGIDIIVDALGKPWLIEANGNPGRICPRVQDEFPEWKNQVYDHPLAYARYLAGFNTPI